MTPRAVALFVVTLFLTSLATLVVTDGGGLNWVLALFCFFFLVFLSFNVVRSRKAARLNNQGLTLLQEGRALEALDHFQRSVPLMANALPLYNLGLAQLQLWRIGDAIKTFERFSSRSGSLLRGVPAGGQLSAPLLGFAYSLSGQTELAAKMLATASATAMAKLGGIVLYCRAGDFDRARSELDANGVLFDQLGGVFRAFTEALSSWARAKTGSPSHPVELVRLFRESNIEVLKPLWPDFYEFLQRAASGPSSPAG